MKICVNGAVARAAGLGAGRQRRMVESMATHGSLWNVKTLSGCCEQLPLHVPSVLDGRRLEVDKADGAGAAFAAGARAAAPIVARAAAPAACSALVVGFGDGVLHFLMVAPVAGVSQPTMVLPSPYGRRRSRCAWQRRCL